MDRQLQKLRQLVEDNFYKSKREIEKKFGKPHKRSDREIWFFRKFSFSFFNDEVAFIFQEDTVVDIILTRYFLWIETKSIFYFEGQQQEYKIVRYI